MPRILYLNHFTALYGSEMSLLGLVTHLPTQWEPLIVLPDDGPLTQRLRGAGLRVETFELAALKARNPFPYLRTVLRLARLCRRERIDLVHANCDLSAQYAIVAARLAAIPVICSTRNILGPRAYRRSFLGFADALIANSQATASTWLPNGRQPRHVVYNAVDLDEFRPSGRGAERRKEYGINADAFVTALVGRITPIKGHDVFLRAHAQVVRDSPDAHAFIVGSTEVDASDDYLEALQQLAHDLRISDCVTFLPAVASVPTFLEMIDVLVSASRVEGFGRILIEAMAMERPVIAAPAAGPREIVMDGETGVFFPLDDADALARAILSFRASPERRRLLGQNGRRRVEELFSIEKHVEHMTRIYAQVLK